MVSVNPVHIQAFSTSDLLCWRSGLDHSKGGERLHLQDMSGSLTMKRHQELGFGLALLLLCTLASGSLAATCSIRDRDSLLAFKRQLTDSTGLLANWKTDTDCCTWTGITCDAQARVTGIVLQADCRTCGPNGQYLIAKISNTFGAPLGNLKTTLKTLSLTNVQIQFKLPIPAVFFTLSKLDFLRLDGCEFSGTIPTALGNLVNLQELRIIGNRFSGGMPNSIGNLKKLRILELRFNQLPQLGSSRITLLKSLTRFDYSRNRVTGTIPKWLGGLTLNPGFGELILSSNQFSGSIPAELCNIRGMSYLSLRGNKLTGRIPGGLGNCKSLDTLNVGQNLLSGPLPRELGKLTNLIRLIADKNQLTGPLPREIGNIPQLYFIELQNNKITGSIPSNWGPSDELAIDPMNFTNNMLKGPIPLDLQNLGEKAFRPGNPGLCGPPLSNPC